MSAPDSPPHGRRRPISTACTYEPVTVLVVKSIGAVGVTYADEADAVEGGMVAELVTLGGEPAGSRGCK